MTKQQKLYRKVQRLVFAPSIDEIMSGRYELPPKPDEDWRIKSVYAQDVLAKLQVDCTEGLPTPDQWSMDAYGCLWCWAFGEESPKIVALDYPVVLPLDKDLSHADEKTLRQVVELLKANK